MVPVTVSTRRDDEIWVLVNCDPVCNVALSLRDNLGANYPPNIADAAVQLAEMIFNETYDRIEGGPRLDVPALQE